MSSASPVSSTRPSGWTTRTTRESSFRLWASVRSGGGLSTSTTAVPSANHWPGATGTIGTPRRMAVA
jgi:hypothetical protein